MDEATKKIIDEQAEQIAHLRRAIQLLERQLSAVKGEASRAKGIAYRNQQAIGVLNRRTGGKG